ncbi:MAG: nucleotidyl transferase AbiEii/AbiGii toxin family protein [Candidatus Delongbacteria bacterium]|nr:nucleotidyl transferase AbiEii/AbiGii toxin family protein [Candidatus Delongbacteria bacterium]
MKENILIKKLNQKVIELKTRDLTDLIIVNALKEELQHYILDFIYNESKYSNLIMYGGSLLRIAYDLPRMSEDLDFQTDKKISLKEISDDLITHFKNRYDLDIEVSINDREQSETKLLKIAFDILNQLDLNISWSKIKIRFDINYFKDASKLSTEIIPKVHDNLSYSIKTYPISTLMSSKILAVMKRTSRGIGKEKTSCKPRDIYDLIWYLKRNSYPDLEYFSLKGEKYQTVLELFDAVKLRVANLEDKLFENDIAQFFYDRTDYDSWFNNWRQTFITLIDSYSIFKVIDLVSINYKVELRHETRHIRYIYSSDNNKEIMFFVSLAGDWIVFSNVRVNSGHEVSDLKEKIESNYELKQIDYEYIGLFYKKIEDFIKRNKKVLYSNRYQTRLIRATADDLNPKEQIFLDKRLLEKIQLEELL